MDPSLPEESRKTKSYLNKAAMKRNFGLNKQINQRKNEKNKGNNRKRNTVQKMCKMSEKRLTYMIEHALISNKISRPTSEYLLKINVARHQKRRELPCHSKDPFKEFY
jgi:hypothetical protein